MKRLYTVTLAALTLLGAVAATPNAAKFDRKVNLCPSVRPVNGKVLTPQTTVRTGVNALPISRDSADDLILWADGESVAYTATTNSFVYGSFGLSYSEETTPAEIIWGEDGDVYIRDIITTLAGGVYVKGTYADGQIRVDLPQLCYYEYYEDGTDLYYASKMELYTFEHEGTLYFSYQIVADEDNYLIYDVAEDGTVTLALNDDEANAETGLPNYIVGICGEPVAGEDDWYGFGDAYQTFTVFDEEPVTVPDDVELEEWVMKTTSYATPVLVGFDGDNVYFSDLDEALPGITFKGTIDGDKVVVEAGQYLGEYYDSYIYLLICQWENDEWEDFEFIDQVVMDYDAEAKVIAVNNELIDLLLNMGNTEAIPFTYLENPTFLYQTAEDTNAAPQDPYVEYFDEYQYRDYMEASEGYIEWIIPMTNVNGFVLDTEMMYYNFYINDEIMTFTVDDYPFFDEDLTDIPYNYEEGFDLQVFDESHYITFKREDAETFGLQSFYIGSDGEVYASHLVTYDPKGSKVTDVEVKNIQSVEFYTIQGQRVAQPANGLYIMRSIYEDGTSTVTKISRR